MIRIGVVGTPIACLDMRGEVVLQCGVVLPNLLHGRLNGLGNVHARALGRCRKRARTPTPSCCSIEIANDGIELLPGLSFPNRIVISSGFLKLPGKLFKALLQFSPRLWVD